jgi:nucleoside-diphosphate-sugar epimerase
MARVVVTGGSGKAGRACVADLIAHGYAVVNVDTVPPAADVSPFIQVDLTDFGQAIEALSEVDSRYKGVDAIVHLAAIPAPGRQPNATVFKTNILSTYNVFEAARRLLIRNIVWASSETVLGLPFDTPPPYIPVDEDYPGRPETAYSLSKLLGEEMAEQFARWDPQTKIIGLRFSNIMEPHDYARFAGFQADVQLRKWNLWGYIDARDGAQAVRLALESDLTGTEVFIIANADTVMSRPNATLVNEFYPNVEVRGDLGEHDTLLAIGKARRLLGYQPAYSWRDAAPSQSGRHE